MYSLTIHFGPNAMCWTFLFKERQSAEQWVAAAHNETAPDEIIIEDDFGSKASFETVTIHGVLLEDLELVEAARIQRSLAEERCKVKLMNAAKTDPVIGPEMAKQQRGAQVLAPNFRQ